MAERFETHARRTSSVEQANLLINLHSEKVEDRIISVRVPVRSRKKRVSLPDLDPNGMSRYGDKYSRVPRVRGQGPTKSH